MAKETRIQFTNVEPNPLNTFPLTDIDDLKAEIATFGLITPLTVIGPYDNGNYRLISGGRRYEAMLQLRQEGNENFQDVPCYIIGDANMSVEKQKYLINAANESRYLSEGERKEHVFEKIQALKEMVDSGEFKEYHVPAILAEQMNISTRQAQFYKKIFEAGEGLQEMVSTGEVSIINAQKIAGIKDEEKREEAIERIKDGEKASNVIKDYQQAKPTPIESNNLGSQYVDLGDDDEDTNEFDDEDLFASSWESSGSSFTKTNDDADENSEAKRVKRWLDQVAEMDISDLTDFEVEVVKLCGQIYEKFEDEL